MIDYPVVYRAQALLESMRESMRDARGAHKA